MTDRLSEVSARIDGIQQLGVVVNAMRGIAAARAQQARGQLVAVDRYSRAVAGALGRALAFLPPSRGEGDPSRRHSAPKRPALILFCAEQGFAGSFSERVLDMVADDIGRSELFLVGTRGLAVARARGVQPGWTIAMPSHSPAIPRLADRIVEALYPRISEGRLDRLDAVFCQWDPGDVLKLRRCSLFPLATGSIAKTDADNPPLLTLPPAVLVDELTADYMHAQLCADALHAFAAENEARMEAMANARNQIQRRLDALQSTARQVRQEEITAEIIELAAGETASRERA